jgi:hypothetical protein
VNQKAGTDSCIIFQICTNMYLVDTFGKYSASALAASKVLQSVVGAFLPLAGKPLFNKLGLGWGNSILGFTALGFLPVPWLSSNMARN